MGTSQSTVALKEERINSDEGKAKQLPGDIQPRDAFIVVMGEIGSGISTFMNTCSGKNSIGVGHGQMSEIRSVASVTLEHNGVKVHLIKIPGFDDTTHSDTDILRCVTSYFAATYQLNIKMDGIIYISPITERSMSSAAIRHLNLLFKMIGNDASSNVVLATNGWNTKTSRWNLFSAMGGNRGSDQGKAEVREKQLREGLWRTFIEEGSKVCRLDGGRNAAIHILDILLPEGQIHGQVLQIQRELVDDMKSLDETEAGQQLSKEIWKQQKGFQRELDHIKSELNDAIAARDARKVQYWREYQAELEQKFSQAVDERRRLRVGFERLVRENWDVNASLFRRLEMESMDKAVIIDKLRSKLRAFSTQVQQNGSYRTAESPHIGKARSQVEAHRPNIQRLEDELEKAQRYVAKKDARMREIRGLMLDVLSDTASSPPRAYTQSATPREPSGITGRQTHLRKTPSNPSDEAKNSDKFRSYIARNETQRESQQGRENALSSNVRAIRSRRPRVNLRVLEEERHKFRAELYQNSLLFFEQDTDSGKASNPILQRRSTDMRDVHALCKQYQFSIGDRQELQDLLSHTLTAMAKDTLTFGAWLFYQSYLLRNAILMVYHNCGKLQNAELAGAWFSILVLEPSSSSRTRVVNLSRVKIDDVREVVDRLSSFVTVLQDLISERTVPHSVSTLTRLSDEVHLLYCKIFERLGLENLFSDHRHRYDLGTELESILSSRSSRGWAYFVNSFAQWWCATRALDVGVVAYESGHVSNSKQTYSIDLGSQLPQLGAFKLQDTPQRPGHLRSLQYVSRGLNCLAGFFERHPVWILAIGEVSNDLYLAADIETFADAWGPVWKVVDPVQPELIAKYDVNGGSIVPWPSNPDIHPELHSNERLCHWKSNDEYFSRRDEFSANVDSSPSSSDSDEAKEADMYSDSSASSSDADETKEDSTQAAYFTGNEILVIEADQDALLE